MELPKRTHATELSDSELILLDCMFSYSVPRPVLEAEKALSHQNTTYSHGLNTEKLNQILKKLKDMHLLSIKKGSFSGEKTEYYGFTSMGGKVWEAERRPIWHLYIEDGVEAETIEGRSVAKIQSYSKETLETCSKYYAETAFLGIPVSKFQQAELHSNNLIYWKKGENAFECSYITQEMNSMRRGTQWELYEKNRTWWRTIGELQKFLPNIPTCSAIVDK